MTGGSGVRDDVPARLNSGEYVIKKSAVQKYGVGFSTQLNTEIFKDLIKVGLMNLITRMNLVEYKV